MFYDVIVPDLRMEHDTKERPVRVADCLYAPVRDCGDDPDRWGVTGK